MQVSEITLHDIPSVRQLQPDDWPDIIPHINFYVNSSFCSPIKVSLNHQVVGIGAAIFHRESAWLGHIIVHKDFTSKGIGSFITQSLLDSIDKNRYETISLIATHLGEPVYAKLGFKKDTDYSFYKSEEHLPAIDLNDSIQPMNLEFADEILKLDRIAFGEDREQLLREHLTSAKLFINRGDVLGFHLPTLGEGLIVAKDEVAGTELLKLYLSTKNTCVLPQENDAGRAFLINNGFKLVRQSPRMSMGKPLSFYPKMLFNRVAGNVG